MKVKGLNGRSYSWDLVGHVPLGNDEVKRSSYHKAARLLLTKLYPLDRVLEELSLPGSDGLTADFFIPSRRLMVETHGEQHYKYIPFFHVNLTGFVRSKTNDQRKRDWCELNDIMFVELPHGDIDGWEQRIHTTTNGQAG